MCAKKTVQFGSMWLYLPNNVSGPRDIEVWDRDIRFLRQT